MRLAVDLAHKLSTPKEDRGITLSMDDIKSGAAGMALVRSSAPCAGRPLLTGLGKIRRSIGLCRF
jgi:hypothetical protein